MIKPKSIDHIVLRTDRYQELIDFYCNIIGCSLERETSDEFGNTQIRAGNALNDIVDVAGKSGKSGGEAPHKKGNHLDHFCLEIELLEEYELTAHLDKHDGECGEFQDRYGAQGMGRSIYFKDIV